jgi:bifunctional non-homologous end joining protein LigD
VDYQFGDITVAGTHPERVIFPADGITKGEMVAYYADVAPLLLPELRGRPLSVVRFTRGIDQKGFFQKHYQKHYPAWLARVTAGTKTIVDYPVVDTAAGVVYLANQGALEFHVWTSRTDDLTRPDLLVFDLDPPGDDFAVVRTCARLVRAACDELGLPAFVKTTGSKGLHVVVPLDDTAAYDEAGALATRIAARLCRRHRDAMTMEFYKKDRKGRLFLDVMRNAIGATFVAPYSLRGKPGAPASVPITWAEVDDPAMASDAIRLRDVRARLEARGDPWHDLRARPGSVAAARRTLDQLED